MKKLLLTTLLIPIVLAASKDIELEQLDKLNDIFCYTPTAITDNPHQNLNQHFNDLITAFEKDKTTHNKMRLKESNQFSVDWSNRRTIFIEDKYDEAMRNYVQQCYKYSLTQGIVQKEDKIRFLSDSSAYFSQQLDEHYAQSESVYPNFLILTSKPFKEGEIGTYEKYKEYHANRAKILKDRCYKLLFFELFEGDILCSINFNSSFVSQAVVFAEGTCENPEVAV